MRNLIAPLLASLLLAVALAGCRGPEPTVVSTLLQPPEAPGSPYLLAVVIKNTVGGSGEAEIEARLRSTSTGQIVDNQIQRVPLKPHEQVQVTIEFQPVGDGPYEPIVSVTYPP